MHILRDSIPSKAPSPERGPLVDLSQTNQVQIVVFAFTNMWIVLIDTDRKPDDAAPV
jgi:hypothetical protein